jgi:hypothetical protein
MADIKDVGDALKNLAIAAVYPNGTNQPSVAGIDVQIFQGWPKAPLLDKSLAAGKAVVSIFSSNASRITTRFDTQWQDLTYNAATITLTVNNTAKTVTLNGTVTTPQSCMVIVNGTGYAYGVQQNDTLTTIAAALAALIPGATASGNVITVNTAYKIAARVGTTGTSVREVAREERVFTVTVWAPPALGNAYPPLYRSQIASAIQSLFAATSRITLPDGYYASLKTGAVHEIDESQKDNFYRRNLDYVVEYAITQSETDYAITNAYSNNTIGPTGQITP